MLKLMTIASAAVLIATAAQAGDAPKDLLGSWRLTHYTLQVIGEQVVEPLGSGAKGSLIITPQRFTVVLSAANRKKATSNEEKAALLNSMLAYTGRYTIDGNKITTDVDTTWNEIFTGHLQKQSRFFEVNGDTLVVKTGEIESAVRPGKRTQSTPTFQRETH